MEESTRRRWKGRGKGNSQSNEGWMSSSGGGKFQQQQGEVHVNGNGSAGSCIEAEENVFGQLGIGTWAWGDAKWGYGNPSAGYDDATLREAFHAALSAGVCVFDTSEIYGRTHAESLLGQCLQEEKRKCFVFTKWHPGSNASTFGGARGESVVDSMRRTVLGSKKRLGVDKLDLLQLHSAHGGSSTIEEYADGLATMVKEGHVARVGVSNLQGNLMRRVHDRLSSTHGIKLFSNQVELSLLELKYEANGTIEECNRLGVLVLAYCPLGMGRLTGKYSASNEPFWLDNKGYKSERYHAALAWPRVDEMVALLKQIGQRNGGKTPAQVALNWCIARGTLPIPGAKTKAQVEENVGALGWRMDDADVEQLNQLSRCIAREANSYKKGGGKGKASGKGQRRKGGYGH